MDLTTVCYKHPDRETGVSCQRCDRYICTDCATPGAVGFLCPEDAGDRVKIHRPAFQKSPLQAAPVTIVLIAINVLVYIAQQIYPTLIDSLAYANIGSNTSYGSIIRVFTSGFTHSNTQLTHILFNMYSLFVLGTVLEPMIGKLRFLILYFIAMFAGAIGVLFLAPFGTSVVGASGAIFGLMAAYLIFLRALKLNAGQMYVIIGINLVLGFIPGIAWQAHVGGLVAGGATAFVLAYTRKREQKNLQLIGLAVVSIVLIGLWLFGNSMVSAIVQ
ncbi:MAG: rhomboid family intramembrane serine protease [Actinobacteria bacterium]|nr:rhomboid family intramembrane serine protease [Actinomycetota bacterium]